MAMKPRNPVPPAAYELTNTPLPFARGTFYRWEAAGIIPPLLRLGGKTLLPAQTVDDILSGKIALPRNSGMTKPPQPRSRPKPKQPA